MRKINKPVISAREVFLTCISQIEDIDLKTRLELCGDAIENASIQYENAGQTNSFHTLPISNNVENIVSIEEIKKVYTQRMARKKSPGEDYYNKLKSLAPRGLCPSCGERDVSTLDHYLPKKFYPYYIVSPLNLVPSCKDCNFSKSDKKPVSADEEVLHPYYDDVENGLWLFSTVIETKPVSINFFVQPPPEWSETLRNKIDHHFKVFNLAYLYSIKAANELCSICYSLELRHSNNGSAGVRKLLQEKAISYSHDHINSWESAMYNSLAMNDWFCSEGFHIVDNTF